MKSVCFILPHPAAGPTGGYKVVYEYANRLAADDIEVHIVYSGSIFWKQKPLRYKLTNCVRYIQQYVKGFSGKKWFDLERRVKEHLTFSMNYRHMPITDLYIATSPYTAWYLNEYPIPNEKKFYLIQDYENWGPALSQILADTYMMPLTKVVISSWLKQMLKNEYNQDSVLLPNGFDFEKFTLSLQIKDKDKYRVSMLYHTMERKRTEDAIEALKIVKKRIPTLRVNAFGVPSRPDNLPDWFDYYQTPNDAIHNRLNNEAAIYVGSSETEGWGLTVGEAMICGQAVCCTDNAGYREMAIDGETALLSPVRNPQALANNVIRLIEDDNLRMNLADTGHKFIQRFRWEDSYKNFKKLLIDASCDL